jgi:predicted ribosome quality control (RQC) complex YloA/Tae2 family protein
MIHKKLNLFLESSNKKFPNIQKKEIDGFQVLIGKDALSNDYLSTIEAYDDDIWFHAKGVPGSHIVIRVKDNIPTKEVIKKVAELAAKNSKCKGTSCKIVYCKAKFVTKDSDMKPGQVKVDYKNVEEIEIEI